MKSKVLSAQCSVQRPDPVALMKRHVVVTILDQPSFWRVSTSAKYAGQVGALVAVISLAHSSGYECVLQFPNGEQEAFNPNHLFPEVVIS